MHLPSFSRPVVCGVDLGSHAIHVAALAERRRGWTVAGTGKLPTGPDAAEGMASLLNRWRFRYPTFVGALPTHAAFVRRRSLPAPSGADVAAAIPGLARDVLPFPATELHLDYHLVESADPATANPVDVLLVAARRDQVRERLTDLAAIGVTPDVLDVEALALTNAYLANYPERRSGPALLVDVGHRSTTVAVVEGSSIASTRAIDFGGRLYLDAPADLYRDLHHQLARELRRFAGDVLDRPDAPVHVMLSGGACRLAGMRDCLSDELQRVAEFANPFRRISGSRPDVGADGGAASCEYMVAVGLALRHPFDRGERR